MDRIQKTKEVFMKVFWIEQGVRGFMARLGFRPDDLLGARAEPRTGKTLLGYHIPANKVKAVCNRLHETGVPVCASFQR